MGTASTGRTITGGSSRARTRPTAANELIYATGEIQERSTTSERRFGSFIYQAGRPAATIRRAALDAGGADGGPFTLLYAPAGGMIAANRIALDDAGLYYPQFNDPGVVQSIPEERASAPAPRLTYASTLHYPVHVAVDANNTLLGESRDPTAATAENYIFTERQHHDVPQGGLPRRRDRRCSPRVRAGRATSWSTTPRSTGPPTATPRTTA